MKVQGFDHLVISVANVEKSLAFYRDVLGLEVLRHEEYKKGDAPFPSVRISSENLIDIVGRKGEIAGNNVDHFCLIIESADLEATTLELKARGVDVAGPPDRRWGARGWGTSIYIKDPDGNTIELKTHDI